MRMGCRTKAQTAHGEAGIVRPRRAATDQYRVMTGAQTMHIAPRNQRL